MELEMDFLHSFVEFERELEKAEQNIAQFDGIVSEMEFGFDWFANLYIIRWFLAKFREIRRKWDTKQSTFAYY